MRRQELPFLRITALYSLPLYYLTMNQLLFKGIALIIISLLCASPLVAQRSSDLMQEGKAKFEKGQIKEAIEDFNKVIYAADEYQVDALLNRGLCYAQLTQLDEAIKDFSRAIDLAPDYAPLYFNRGLARLQKNEWKAAHRDFTITIDLAPGDVEAYLYRGIVRQNLGELTNALSDFNTALQRDSNLTPAYYHRGLVLLALHRYQPAINDFSEVIKRDAGNGLAYALRGKAKNKLSAYYEALQDLNIALILIPDLAEAFVYRGRAIAGLGNLEEALENFKAARSLGFDATELKIEEIRVLWLQQKISKAQNALDSLLLGQPDNVDGLFLRASMNYAQKQWQLAEADLKKCLQLSSYFWDAHELLALIAREQNRYTEAVEHLNKAIKLNSDYAELYYQRAQAYWKAGDSKKACADLRKSKQLGKTIVEEEFSTICGT
jgi:tetratricopeptide (TPR) repeat protein